jgi:predicted N-acetyltransferase YhbS
MQSSSPAGEGFEVLPLHRARDCAATLAAWHAAEWAHLYPDWDEDRALRELLAEPGVGRLPLTLIARDENSLLGSVSLIFDDLPGWPALNPWLASLYVAPGERRRGIGAALVQAACRVTDDLACARLYLFTESAQDYFQRLGFRIHASAVTQGHPVTVMVRATDALAQGCSET